MRTTERLSVSGLSRRSGFAASLIRAARNIGLSLDEVAARSAAVSS